MTNIQTAVEAKKVFVTDNQAQWIVFEEEMQAGFEYQLASIEDLHDFISASGEVLNNVETSEGIVQWHTEDSEDFGYVCEYRVIN